MKKLLLLLLVAPLIFAANSMRDMNEFNFVPIQEGQNVKLEELTLHDEAIDYVITLTSNNGLAYFEWMCELVPFLYVPELKDLGPTDEYEITIALNNSSTVINHYTVHPKGILLSKEYLTNHHKQLIEAVVVAESMSITLADVVGRPKYQFDTKNLQYKILSMLQKCKTIF